MIFVFVVDTSPTMGKPAFTGLGVTSTNTDNSSDSNGLSRLDVAKMVIEDFNKQWRKLRQRQLQSMQSTTIGAVTNTNSGTAAYLGPLGQLPVSTLHNPQHQHQLPDQFLLISTSRQHSDTTTCAAGGRLLVGYHHPYPSGNVNATQLSHQQQQPNAVDAATVAAETFHRELKNLKVATVPTSAAQQPWSDEYGGAAGLNIALSTGLELLSKYRLTSSKYTEHYGMGRIPNNATSVVLSSSDSSQNLHIASANSALQPGCVIILTDGACLRLSERQGGGSLQLHYGNVPLREFYQEPFRWDQRIFIQAIGSTSMSSIDTMPSSTQYLHPQLRTLCEVTGGAHFMVRYNYNTNAIQNTTNKLLKHICPTMPKEIPIPDPLYTRIGPPPGMTQCPPIVINNTASSRNIQAETAHFMNAGPICCFQSYESIVSSPDISSCKGNNIKDTIRRAMLLYVGSTATTSALPSSATRTLPGNVEESSSAITSVISPPVYCIPESYFPNKMLDTLPPRLSQPKLVYSTYPNHMGMKSFVPQHLIQQLHKLDQMHVSIHNYKQQLYQLRHSIALSTSTIGQVKLLHRDVYICEWVDVDDCTSFSSGNSNLTNKGPVHPLGLIFKHDNLSTSSQTPPEYYPIFVRGAARPSLSEDGENLLNIGILHIPPISTDMNGYSRLSTLTLLPPDPHIVIPLLIRAAEIEYRAWKKAIDNIKNSDSNISKSMLSFKVNVAFDEQWKSEFRAYLFRIPVYYHNSVKRVLRAILPSSVHSTLLHIESIDYIMSQCFSKVCYQKIRNGEIVAKDTNERMERQETMVRYCKNISGNHAQLESSFRDDQQPLSKHRPAFGHFDFRISDTDTYLASIRNIPAPWRLNASLSHKPESQEQLKKQMIKTATFETAKQKEPEAAVASSPTSILDILGDLPANCLLPFYESRRRWVFGGSGLNVRGLNVDGAPNDGCNTHYWSNHNDACLLSLGDVGGTVANQKTTNKMGEYKERLLFSRSPIVGYGSNDATGVSATTAIDGAPIWSVDDDAMPITFFDAKTGEFSDSTEARVRSMLMVNFGNPYKEKRANSIVPERFVSQLPSMFQNSELGSIASTGSSRISSPPHDSFDSVEEGEAIFVINSPSRKSPKRDDTDTLSTTILPPLPLSPITMVSGKRPRSDSDDTIESSDNSNVSERSNRSLPHLNPPPPPPPRPSAPKQTIQGENSPLSTTVKPQRPPPPKKPKPIVPPPPPNASLTKKTPPPPPPSKLQTQPPKPVETIESNNFSIGQSLSEDLNIKTKPIPDEKFVTDAEIPSELRSAANTEILIANAEEAQNISNVLDTELISSSKLVSSSIAAQKEIQINSKQQSPIESSVLVLDDEKIKPNVDLPANWICVWSKSQKRWYFFDTKTNKSLWNWPP